MTFNGSNFSKFWFKLSFPSLLLRSYDRINWNTEILDSGDGVVFTILDPHDAEVRGVLLSSSLSNLSY